MTVDELVEILDCHGCDQQHWPASKRQACLDLIADDAAAALAYQSARELEEKLDTLQVPQFSELQRQILNQSLPPQARGAFDRFIAWLLPESGMGSRLFRPALAATLPLVMGIVLGNFFSFGIAAGSDGFQYWEDELLMLSFSEYSETELQP